MQYIDPGNGLEKANLIGGLLCHCKHARVFVILSECSAIRLIFYASLVNSRLSFELIFFFYVANPEIRLSWLIFFERRGKRNVAAAAAASLYRFPSGFFSDFKLSFPPSRLLAPLEEELSATTSIALPIRSA